MGKKKISQLTAASTLTGEEALPCVQSGSTKKATAKNIAKSGYKELTGTLTAGSTSLVFQDASITAASWIDGASSVYGVNPTAAVAAAGSLTLTFEAQQTNIDVKVRIS